MEDLLDDLDLDDPMEGDFDDIDMSELVAAAETIEQEHRSGQITFVPNSQDPTPPAPLPEDTPSFHPLDIHSLCTWTYPINYPVRGYQLNIVQKALFNNTLVALPTGLGKTFIAAVVMYNYWRWFPNSKVIFMAPTRPLVDQQIEACFHICGLPQSDTCDMTGSTPPTARRTLWKTKRVFFATPQTVQKDIIAHACPIDQVVCIVVDEAHKATGNYAYADVVSRIAKKHPHFRVLALTATPGSNLDAVQDVISNLCITHIQIRTEDSMDIREFSHGKNVQNVIVPLSYTEGGSGDLPSIISRFRDHVFKPFLLDLSKKPTDVTEEPDRWSAYRLRNSRTYFSATAKNYNKNLMFLVVSTFLIAESVSRAYEMLCTHGVGPFLETLEGVLEEMEEKKRQGKKLTAAQSKLGNNITMKRLMEELQQKRQRPDFIGHPKMEKLLAILISHFGNLEQGKASKVMIFSSFRSSVMDICNVLARHDPLIRATYFVGQATSKKGTKGLKQTEQQEVIQKFKSDSYNVLVATSIGEEGLDIGEVDLIICYDSQTSPIRMLQRMGRTGRQRRGKCILLMTEQEEKKFSQAKEAYTRIQQLISQGGILNYYRPNPTVIPMNYKPTIERKVLTIGNYQSTNKRKRTTQTRYITHSGQLTPDSCTALLRSFGRSNLDELIAQDWPLQSLRKSLNKYVPLHVHEKPCFRIGHSRRTTEFVHLVQRIEHRIMHPGEEDMMPKRRQTRLVLPKRAAKKKKAVYDVNPLAVDDLDFQTFMDHHHISHILEPNAESEAKDETLDTNEILENLQAGDKSAAENKDQGVKNRLDKRNKTNTSLEDFWSREKSTIKGKSHSDFKGLFTTESDAIGDLHDTTFEAPLVSDKSLMEVVDDIHFEEDKNLEDISEEDDKDSNILKRDKGKSRMIEEPEEIDSGESWEALLPESVYEDDLTWNPKQGESSKAPLEPNSHDEFGDIDFGDDFKLLEMPDKLPEYFDDYLAPRFPFEKEMTQNTATATATFVWARATPEFTAKALQLLKQRQNRLKKVTGQFVSVSVSDYVENELLPSDDDAMQQPEKKDESLVEFDFDLFSNLDEFDLGDLIENRVDGEHSYQYEAEKQTIQSNKLNSQASLYYQTEKDDEVIMFDFENMTQDSSLDGSPPNDTRLAANNDQEGRSRENSGSSLLMQLSTGHYTSPLRTNPVPKSPLRINLPLDPIHNASPLRTSALPTQDSPSPILRRRKRVISEDSIESSDALIKRHKRIIPKDSQEEEEHLVRQRQLMDQFKKTSKKMSHHYSKEERLANPFIDDEAEKSSDGGHTSEEDEEGSNLDSFIDDDDEDNTSRASIEKQDVYRVGFDQDATQTGKRQNWLDRIDFDKYHQEDDDIVGETDDSVIEDFSSDLAPKENIIISSDDDFA